MRGCAPACERASASSCVTRSCGSGTWLLNASLVGVALALFVLFRQAVSTDRGALILAMVLAQQTLVVVRTGLRVALLGEREGARGEAAPARLAGDGPGAPSAGVVFAVARRRLRGRSGRGSGPTVSRNRSRVSSSGIDSAAASTVGGRGPGATGRGRGVGGSDRRGHRALDEAQRVRAPPTPAILRRRDRRSLAHAPEAAAPDGVGDPDTQEVAVEGHHLRSAGELGAHGRGPGRPQQA